MVGRLKKTLKMISHKMIPAIAQLNHKRTFARASTTLLMVFWNFFIWLPTYAKAGNMGKVEKVKPVVPFPLAKEFKDSVHSMYPKVFI